MNFKSWVYLFLIVVFTLISWVFYTHNIKGFYGYAKDNERLMDAVEVSDTLLPLSFKFNSDEPILSQNFEQFKDSICQTAHGKQVEIIGYFDTLETHSTSYGNMGLARAAKIKALFTCIDSNDLTIQSQYRSIQDTIATDALFKIVVTEQIDVTHLDSAVIVGSENHFEIYFPTNATKQKNSAKLEETLKQIANEIQSNHKKIHLIGHTDPSGSPSSNQILSLNRSLSIKEQLIKLGVSEQNIHAEGQGDRNPKVPNTSEQNKSLNRRVQLIIE